MKKEHRTMFLIIGVLIIFLGFAFSALAAEFCADLKINQPDRSYEFKYYAQGSFYRLEKLTDEDRILLMADRKFDITWILNPEDYQKEKSPIEKAQEKAAARPVLTGIEESIAPVGRRLKTGAALKVKVDPDKSVQIVIKNQIKEKSTYKIIPFKEGLPIEDKIIHSDLTGQRKKSERSFGEQLKLDEVLIEVKEGLVSVLVTKEYSSFDEVERKEYFVMEKSGQGLFARENRKFIVTLTGDSLGQDDTFTAFAASYQITHPFAAGWMANASLTANARKNTDLSQFDTTALTLQAGITRLYKESRFKTSILAQDYALDGDDYRSLSGLNFEWFKSLSQQSSMTTTLQFASLDYPDLPIKNSDLMTLGLGYKHSFSSSLSPVLFGSINIGSETAEDGSNAGALSDTERDILGIKAGVVLSFTPKLALQTSIGLQTSEYAGPNLPILLLTGNSVIREDDYTTADVSMIWLFSKNWRLDTKFSYAENSSNIELFFYDRTSVNLNLNYAF